jgi:hypothetical protein
MSHKANIRESGRRAVATFIAGATAAPLNAALFDIEFFKSAAIAGVIAVWNFAGRWAQYELSKSSDEQDV